DSQSLKAIRNERTHIWRPSLLLWWRTTTPANLGLQQIQPQINDFEEVFYSPLRCGLQIRLHHGFINYFLIKDRTDWVMLSIDDGGNMLPINIVVPISDVFLTKQLSFNYCR
uniref:DUF4912 domain-containing protein n=1 Tax=Haemonchus placei TaxID=6290 RepID=A0A0N4WJH7_HAEPC